MIEFQSKSLNDHTMIVQVSGSLTGANRDYFFDWIADMIDRGMRHVVIECHQIGYLNSNGLALLIAARNRAAKKGCRIFLTHVSSNLAEILEFTKLGRLLSVYPTTESALDAIEGRELNRQPIAEHAQT